MKSLIMELPLEIWAHIAAQPVRERDYSRRTVAWELSRVSGTLYQLLHKKVYSRDDRYCEDTRRKSYRHPMFWHDLPILRVRWLCDYVFQEVVYHYRRPVYYCRRNREGRLEYEAWLHQYGYTRYSKMYFADGTVARTEQACWVEKRRRDGRLCNTACVSLLEN